MAPSRFSVSPPHSLLSLLAMGGLLILSGCGLALQPGPVRPVVRGVNSMTGSTDRARDAAADAQQRSNAAAAAANALR